MSFTFPSYKEAMQMGKEKLASTLIPIKAKKAQKKAESAQLDLEEKVAELTVELTEMCTVESPDFEKIIDLQDELTLTERRLEQYNTILEQMFPE